MKKEYFECLLKNIDRNSLWEYYKNHTVISTAENFGVSVSTIKKVIDSYGLKKSKQDTLNTRKQTCLEKYGVENVFQDSERMRKSYIEKYGVDNPFKSEEIKEKIRKTNLKKYGVESPLQNKDILKKYIDTSTERYGGVGFASDELKKKSNNTALSRYGDTSNREKARQTFLEKYGVDNPFKSEEVKEQIKKTNLEKYGTEFSFQSDFVKEKIRKTNLDRYGEEIYAKTEDSKEKHRVARNKKIESKGCLLKTQENLDSRLVSMLYSEKDSIDFLKSNDCKYSILQLSEMFNCSASCVVHWIKRLNLYKYINYYSGSKYEDELYFMLKKFGFRKHAKVLNGKEIDLYNDEKKLGIEFNGTYWHSDINKHKKYHEEKSKTAESLGIRLIHIYEYEWLDERVRPIILSLIEIACGNVKTKINARQCEVRIITNKEAKEFNNKNHLQGHRNALVTYGLFYKGELVQLMSFSKHKKYDWEIIRGCPGSNNIVVGGVSKLFKHFVNDYKPKSVFSYCDFNKFDGRGYEKLGMKFIGYTGPDKKWIVNGKVYNRQPSKYKQFKKLSEACIWGAGSKKYLWEG